MKRNAFFRLILTVLFTCYISSSMFAQQKDVGSQISYKVNFGPVYPIEGDSNQIQGKISFNDENNSIEKISFDVPLNSFTGINAGYLEWIGNSWYNPDMSFRSNNIKFTDDNKLTVTGNLEFRRRSAPIKIDFTRKDSDNSIILEGNFDMRIRDYFIFHLPLELAPSTVSFKIKLVFDKPITNT